MLLKNEGFLLIIMTVDENVYYYIQLWVQI